MQLFVCFLLPLLFSQVSGFSVFKLTWLEAERQVFPSQLNVSTTDLIQVLVNVTLSNCANVQIPGVDNLLYFNQPGRLLLYTSCPPPLTNPVAAVDITVSDGEQTCEEFVKSGQKVDFFGTSVDRNCSTPLVFLPKTSTPAAPTPTLPPPPPPSSMNGFGIPEIPPAGAIKPPPPPAAAPSPVVNSSTGGRELSIALLLVVVVAVITI